MKPSKESKGARFTRVVQARVSKIIKMLRLLGNCSNRNTYQYSESDVKKIFATLQYELDRAHFCYENHHRFSLRDDCDFQHALRMPHLFLDLPDKTQLMAVAYSGTDYPAINLYLVKPDSPIELVCFAEFSPELCKDQSLCVGVYQSDSDETKYYAAYTAEGDQYET